MIGECVNKPIIPKEGAVKKYYGGIDLHSNNNVIVVIDAQGKTLQERRLPNQLPSILEFLSPFAGKLHGLVVESTYNWYWLVDGLMEEGYKVHLANTNAIQQYDGLKHTDDRTDARWLAEMLRLGVLPEGYIYPKAERGIRDLLRKRMRFVQYRTRHFLSVKSHFSRQLGRNFSCSAIRKLDEEMIHGLVADPFVAHAALSNIELIRSLDQQIKRIEKSLGPVLKIKPEYQGLLSVDGIGMTLAATISMETGDIRRFEDVGNFASYCRCVRSERRSNKKKKGKNNTKNGNKYLAWAFIEAAQFARRSNERARSFYQRKAARTKPVIARKALAHKLARACYFVMRDQALFDASRVFS
jgi:transposase